MVRKNLGRKKRKTSSGSQNQRSYSSVAIMGKLISQAERKEPQKARRKRRFRKRRKAGEEDTLDLITLWTGKRERCRSGKRGGGEKKRARKDREGDEHPLK